MIAKCNKIVDDVSHLAVLLKTGDLEYGFLYKSTCINTACIGEIDNEKVVYIGSHDYHLYAFKAKNGDLLWKRALGGEVYSAPCFFNHAVKALVAAASLDNHLYIIDARNGDIVISYFTGRPIWDKVAKGDTLWGSPVAIEAEEETALIHGSFNDVVYMLPVAKEGFGSMVLNFLRIYGLTYEDHLLTQMRTRHSSA